MQKTANSRNDAHRGIQILSVVGTRNAIVVRNYIPKYDFKACPQQAIYYREDGKCVINQDKCMGCGWCKLECKSGDLCTQQTFPMRSSVNEYFLKEHRIDDGISEQEYQAKD